MTIKILKNPSQEDLNVFLRQNYIVRRADFGTLLIGLKVKGI